MILQEVAAPSRAATGEAPRAEVRERYENAVQLDLGLAVVGVAYERVIARRVAVQSSVHVFGTWFGPIVDQPNFRGLGVQLRPSFFLTEDAPTGVYVAPFLRVEQVTAEADGKEGSGLGWSAGAFLGYAFALGSRFSARVGAGVQYMHYVVDARGTRVAFDTPFPAIDLVVGYAF